MISLVDTAVQTVTVRDASRTVQLSRHDELAHAPMPQFALRVNELFERIGPK